MTADALTWLDAGAAPGSGRSRPPTTTTRRYVRVTAADHESVHAALTDLLAGALEEQPCLMS